MSFPDRVNSTLIRFGDLVLALAVIGMVAVLVIKIPPAAMDALFATNIAVSVLVLLVALSIPDAAKLPSFPAILLLTTLFRLTLNISSTRLILLDGYAGQVIQAFGEAVVGGSYIVGAVVFVVLVFVQFVVIAKGSERVAEVAARFTLDSMPGKQMSIDADVRSGLMTPEEARVARRQLERESKLYGAMDGAMKFVKGDAIAGIVIAMVIMCGGLAIGVWQKHLPLTDAAQTYALLTIGDGLVAQIPSILISIAAGLVVTRVAAGDSADAPVARDIASQILAHPRALFVTMALLVSLALMPLGFPPVPFLVLAGIAGVLGLVAWRRGVLARPGAAAVVPVVGLSKHPALEADLDEVARRLEAIRLSLQAEFGVTIGPVGVRRETPLGLAEGGYCVDIRSMPAAIGVIPASNVVALTDAASALAAGLAATPVAAAWASGGASLIPASQMAAADAAKIETLSAEDAIIRHGEWTLRRKLHTLLGIQDVSAIIESLRISRPDLVRAVVPGVLSVPVVADVLRRLLREGVPIRDGDLIFESLAKHAAATKNPQALTERVRRDLADSLCARFAEAPGRLSFYAADPDLENLVSRGSEETSEGQVITLSHDEQKRVVDSLRRAIDPRRHTQRPPVLLVSGVVRRAVRTVIEDSLPEVAVLSYDELSRDVELERLGLVVLEEQ